MILHWKIFMIDILISIDKTRSVQWLTRIFTDFHWFLGWRSFLSDTKLLWKFRTRIEVSHLWFWGFEIWRIMIFIHRKNWTLYTEQLPSNRFKCQGFPKSRPLSCLSVTVINVLFEFRFLGLPLCVPRWNKDLWWCFCVCPDFIEESRKWCKARYWLVLILNEKLTTCHPIS